MKKIECVIMDWAGTSAVCYAERVYGSDFRRDRND